jgi:hypothetical protein
LNWTDGNPSKVVQPPAPLLLQGWTPGQPPPAQYTNWQIWLADQWIQYLDQLTNTGIPDQAIRLINGGFWNFVASTGLLSWSAAFNVAIPSLPDVSNQVAAGGVNLTDGQIAYITANIPISATGTTDGVTNQITSMNFTGNIQVGYSCTGPGIPGGTTVTGVTSSGVVLSNNTTSANLGATYTFAPTAASTVQVANSATFFPSFGTLVLARRVGNKIYLGVNSTQMTLHDGEFKFLGSTGYLQTYAPVAGVNLTAGQIVYISQGPALDGGRTLGQAYPLDASAGNPQRSMYAGTVVTSVTAGNKVDLTFSGFFAGSGLTVGNIYYADPSNPGGLTNTRPTGAGVSIIPIGLAIAANTLLLTNAEGLPAAPQNQSVLSEDNFVGNGAQTVFVTSAVPLNQASTMVYIDGVKIPPSAGTWTLTGMNVTFSAAPAVGVSVDIQYVDANTYSIALIQEVPTTMDRQTFVLNQGIPINKNGTMLFVDGVKIQPGEFTLTLGAMSASIFLTAGPLAPGQSLEASYFSNVAASGGIDAGDILGGANLGTGGQGVFKQVSSGIMQFLSLKAGSNVSIAPDGLGNLVISATGGGGGGGYTRGIYPSNGASGSPETFNPASGLNPGIENDQTWYLSTGAGQETVTASPAIAPGTVVGQRLTLRGVDAINYYTFNGFAGTVIQGLSLNGNCNIDNNQSLVVEWDGINWYEITRRA